MTNINWMGWTEFFKGENGLLSSIRLTVLIGCVVGSGVVTTMTILETLTEGVFGLYLAYCGGVYGMMKFSDNSVTKAGITAATPTIIENVEQINKVTESGNVTVGKK